MPTICKTTCIAHKIISAAWISIIFLKCDENESQQLCNINRSIASELRKCPWQKVGTAYIWAQTHIRFNICARSNASIASSFILVQIVDRTDGVIFTTVMMDNAIVLTCSSTRSFYIEIDLVVDVALDEVGYLCV